MNNSDSPAMPLMGDAYTDLTGYRDVEGRYEDGMGLTKREHFAAMAMQGILSNPTCKTVASEWKENIARDCLEITDALLKALDDPMGERL